MLGKKILFIVSPRGNGHVVRCRALGLELAQRGYRSSFTSRPPLSADSFDASVIDGYEYGEEVFKALNARPTIQIEDEPGVTIFGDLLVCGSIGVEKYASEKKSILGSRFALLREEFREYRRPWGIPRGVVKNSGILMAEDLKDASASQVVQQMLAARVVVTKPSMTAIEAICLGVPIVLVKGQSGDGTSMNWEGLEGLVGRALLPFEANMLLSGLSDEALEGWTYNTKDLVDGYGTVRVANAIEELLR